MSSYNLYVNYFLLKYAFTVSLLIMPFGIYLYWMINKIILKINLGQYFLCKLIILINSHKRAILYFSSFSKVVIKNTSPFPLFTITTIIYHHKVCFI